MVLDSDVVDAVVMLDSVVQDLEVALNSVAERHHRSARFRTAGRRRAAETLVDVLLRETASADAAGLFIAVLLLRISSTRTLALRICASP